MLRLVRCRGAALLFLVGWWRKVDRLQSAVWYWHDRLELLLVVVVDYAVRDGGERLIARGAAIALERLRLVVREAKCVAHRQDDRL